MKTKMKCFVRTVTLSFFILSLVQFGKAQDALNIKALVEETFYVDGDNQIKVSSKLIENKVVGTTDEMIGFSLIGANKIKEWKQIIIFDKNENPIKKAQFDSDRRISTPNFGDSIKVEFYKPKFWGIRSLVGTKYWKTEELKGLDVTFTWINE